MDDYKIIVEQEHSTVAAHYEVEPKPDGGYQSEAKLETALIKQLQWQGYEYATQVKDEASLLKNLRRQLELLNDVVLSDAEWTRLLPLSRISEPYIPCRLSLYAPTSSSSL